MIFIEYFQYVAGVSSNKALTENLRNFRVNFKLIPIDLCIDQVRKLRTAVGAGAMADSTMIYLQDNNRRLVLERRCVGICSLNVLFAEA